MRPGTNAKWLKCILSPNVPAQGRPAPGLFPSGVQRRPPGPSALPFRGPHQPKMASALQEGKKSREHILRMVSPPLPYHQGNPVPEASCRCFLLSRWPEICNVLSPKPITGKGDVSPDWLGPIRAHALGLWHCGGQRVKQEVGISVTAGLPHTEGGEGKGSRAATYAICFGPCHFPLTL